MHLANMSLPDVPRVLYAKAPLEQVICQLRFPTILKINLETPPEFPTGSPQ